MPKRTIPFLVTLSLFGLALAFVLNVLDPLFYTEKVRQIAPPGLKNTVLSIITIMALLVALVAQPLMGRWSDRTRSRWGRRLPFLMGGVLGVCLSLALIVGADQLWLLIGAAMLLSGSSNTLQGAWQALIPDLVPHQQRGRAAAIKTMLEGLGGVAGATAAGYTLAQGLIWGAPVMAIILFVFILGLTLFTLARSGSLLTSSPASGQEAAGPPPTPPLDFNQLELTLLPTFFQLSSRLLTFLRHTPPFFWWILNRILFWSAAIALKTFALNYIEDVPTMSLAEIRTVGNNFIFGGGVGVLVVVLLAGLLADRIGRRPLLITAGLLAVGGTLLLMMGPDLTWLVAAGGVLVTSGGVYASASWALATDLVPQNKGALYLGLANGATVIGSISGRLGGPLIDSVNHLTGELSLGYLVVFALACLCFLGSSLVILKIPNVHQRTSARA